MTNQDDIAVAEFNSAVTIARRALEEFRRHLLCPRSGVEIAYGMVGRLPRLVCHRATLAPRGRAARGQAAAWPYQDEFDKLDALLDDSQE